ncbi:hypothetical protein E2C01_062547 [Portunus trituberculatus]|uniref:Uncharacterized protein n=1 Tax=Portunus trituberculatus TaxID=210409 RepID=A0A5B7HGD5_PORTR|nr:hypothetical protein [Portunus trituberculatus]
MTITLSAGRGPPLVLASIPRVKALRAHSVLHTSPNSLVTITGVFSFGQQPSGTDLNTALHINPRFIALPAAFSPTRPYPAKASVPPRPALPRPGTSSCHE